MLVSRWRSHHTVSTSAVGGCHQQRPGELQVVLSLPTTNEAPTFSRFSVSHQLEFERSQVRRLEKEQRRLAEQLEEERAQYKQLSCALAKECKWASTRALEEGHRLAELSRKLDKVAPPCGPFNAFPLSVYLPLSLSLSASPSIPSTSLPACCETSLLGSCCRKRRAARRWAWSWRRRGGER